MSETKESVLGTVSITREYLNTLVSDSANLRIIIKEIEFYKAQVQECISMLDALRETLKN